MCLSLCPRVVYAGTCVGSYEQADSWASRWLAHMLVAAAVGEQILGSLGGPCSVGDGSRSGRMTLWVLSGAGWVSAALWVDTGECQQEFSGRGDTRAVVTRVRCSPVMAALLKWHPAVPVQV